MKRGRPREFEKQAALRSAMLVFWKKGYRNTSIEDLTEELGINRPSLYGAFGDKAELFRAALDLYVEDYGRNIADKLSNTPGLLDAIESFLCASVGCFADKDLPGGCLISVHAGDSELDSDVRARLLKISALTEKALADRFKLAIKSGEIDKHHSAAQLSSLTFCVLTGLSHAARTGASRRKLNGIVASFLEGLAKLID